MTTTSDSTMERSHHRPWGPCSMTAGRRGNWSGLNLTAMILGFVLFWPAGLLMLFWILRGRDVRELPGAVRHQWTRLFGDNGTSRAARTGNSAFDTFQQTQYERIRELKEEIGERARRFREFRAAARRQADEEEFDRFMASMPEQPES